MRDVENLWKAGLALGASLDNTIALADDRIMNAEGLRYPQEFVRHKMLDAVGDLALAGAPMLGAYRSVRGGHRLNAHVLQALFADKDAWTMVRAPWVRETVPVDDCRWARPRSTTQPTAPEFARGPGRGCFPCAGRLLPGKRCGATRIGAQVAALAIHNSEQCRPDSCDQCRIVSGWLAGSCW